MEVGISWIQLHHFIITLRDIEWHSEGNTVYDVENSKTAGCSEIRKASSYAVSTESIYH